MVEDESDKTIIITSPVVDDGDKDQYAPRGAGCVAWWRYR